MERHKKAVSLIASTVRSFYDRGESFRIFHGSTNSTRPSHNRRVVDTSDLSHVLKIDKAAKTALVEPNVPMDRLVETTLKYGLVPPVVMEFPGITVGGGYAGTSGESSSFKHGFFNRTMNHAEIVLANGDVVRASPHEHADLFHGAAGAVGSLGVVTLVELQLEEAKSHVETTYHPVTSIKQAVEMIQKLSTDTSIDYLDGIIFSKSQGAIITGRTTNHVPASTKIQTFGGPWDPWFYCHVQDRISQASATSTEPPQEAVPLEDYLFRYDRGGFWVGRSAFSYFSMPFTKYTRWFLDEFTRTRMMYSALHASGESKRYMVQDLALPYATAEEFMNYTHDTFNIYPLWLCPLRQSPLPTMHPHLAEYEADGTTPKPMLNIGLWGYGPKNLNLDAWAKLNRSLEFKLRELKGMKWLYAHTYYTEDEFWQVYDKTWYDELRKKYGATSLPSVYEKVKVDVRKEKEADEKRAGRSWLAVRPLGGLWGIWKAIQSGEYLKARRSTWKSIESREEP